MYLSTVATASLGVSNEAWFRRLSLRRNGGKPRRVRANPGQSRNSRLQSNRGLLALKERSPTVQDIILDMDTITVSKANAQIEGTAIRTVVMGEVYLEKKGTGKAQQFLCLIGEKGKVLLTFFVAP
jgi:hypothetical protein